MLFWKLYCYECYVVLGAFKRQIIQSVLLLWDALKRINRLGCDVALSVLIVERCIFYFYMHWGPWWLWLL